MPGPLAAQTAMWLGYLHAGARGALAIAVPFVVPPFLIVTAVAVFYAEYQGLDWVHAVFLGVGPAVLAIIAIAAYKLAWSTNKTDPVLWAIAAILCGVTAIAGAEIVWLFLPPGPSVPSTTGEDCRRCVVPAPRVSRRLACWPRSRVSRGRGRAPP